MNISDARGVLTIHGYIGEYRLVWKSNYQPVLKTDEKGRKIGPEYFPTQDAAEVAAWRKKNELEQPLMVRSGEILSAPRREAEGLFRKKGEAA